MAVNSNATTPCFPLQPSSDEAAAAAAARANTAAAAAEDATEDASQAASDANDAKDAADAAVEAVNEKLALVQTLEEIYGGAYVNEQVSGSTINITDGADNVPVKALSVAISGASPALTAVTINKTVNGLNTPYTMSLVSGGTQLSVTEGTLDFVNGVLVSGGNTYDLDAGGTDIPTSLGENTFATTAGVMTMVYRADPELYALQNYLKIIRVSDTAITLGQILSELNTINANGYHVLFDVSALGAQMYLCIIFIDTSENVYKVFDLVKGRVAEGAYDASLLLTMAIAQASNVATQQQIDYLQGEIDELGGKSVVANWDLLGDMIRNGTSTDVVKAGDITSINWIKTVLGTTTSGLTVTCSDIDKFANAVGEAEAKDYLFVYDGSSWTYGGEAITLSGFGLSVSGTPATGEVMNIKTTVESVDFTFTGYDDITPADDDVPHNWLLEQTYAPATKAFDTYESLFCLLEGEELAAGKYYIPMYSYRSGKTFNCCFTLASDIQFAEKLAFKSNGYTSGTIKDNTGADVASAYYPASLKFVYYSSGAETAYSGNITLSFMSDTDAASGGYTNLLTMAGDAYTPPIIPGSFDTATFGNNEWGVSNNRQWLNNDKQSNGFVQAHPNDIASAYNNGAGFLYGIDPRVKPLIQYASVPWTGSQANTYAPHYKPATGTAPSSDAPTYYERTGKAGARVYTALDPQPSAGDDVSSYFVSENKYAYNTTYMSEDKVFLLSMSEMAFDINRAEGTYTDLYAEYTNNAYTNSAVAARAKSNKPGGTTNSYRWSRSAYVYYASFAWYVSASGSYDFSLAGSGLYYAPAFIIGKSQNQ